MRARAREASEGKDIRLERRGRNNPRIPSGRTVDEMHLAYAPGLLGWGERLLAGSDLPAPGYHLDAPTTTANSMHVLIAKKNL